MGLLDGTTHQQYYTGNDHGNYQFTSLDDVISQFIVAYVGEDKIISKITRTDVAFHAQRAMQELSFDTFKSVKSHQIDIPASLTMILPHDYVNYTKISWADSAGIKHPLYPTSSTSNPFQISQDADGNYEFPQDAEEVFNGDFSSGLDNWVKSESVLSANGNVTFSKTEVTSSKVVFSHRSKSDISGAQTTPNDFSYTQYVYQELDVSDKQFVTLSASGEAVDITSGTGVLRVGLSTTPPDTYLAGYDTSILNNSGGAGVAGSLNTNESTFDVLSTDGTPAYIEWTVAGDNTLAQNLAGINVSNLSTVYVIAISYHDFTAVNGTLTATNNVDDISVINSLTSSSLTANSGNEKNSSTWNSYKSGTPSENQDDYQDDTYWPMDGSRYGLDPQHAQANGSFYMDNRLGKIHFSSNIAGKTVILDYISDSLGTDGEMQVHKFAEEAIYKWIAHAILATRANTQEYLVNRFKKERFAAVRTAKLRLSSIKLEEITQILRGKSKQIKH
jgi:hypothetical protein